MEERKAIIRLDERPERAFLVALILPDFMWDQSDPLSELRGLVEAAGAEPIDGLTQKLDRPVPRFLIGSGKVEEIKRSVEALDIDLVVFDNDLSPGQVRNLEKELDRRVVDRSELILDIFARRARTRQAMAQVELAQLQYTLPRLRRMWTHLERTEGAVGTRGPGETQLETDRRLIRIKIRDLKRRLEEFERRKEREVDARHDLFQVSLVGYTNVGKSTLLNRLTGSEELVADQLFATLDTRTRQWRLPDGRTVLLSDTVGFVRSLPHHLVASFHATLEEARRADLLLVVLDVSSPDAMPQAVEVERVLEQVGAADVERLFVLNKFDRVENHMDLEVIRKQFPNSITVSARTGEGIPALENHLVKTLDDQSRDVVLEVPIADGKAQGLVRCVGVLLEEDYTGGVMRATLRATERELGRLRHELRGGRMQIVSIDGRVPEVLD